MQKSLNIPPFIAQYIDRLHSLCERFNVDRLYAFGSVLTDRFDQAMSDVDLQVELLPMKPVDKGETLLDLWDELEELFGRKVDLITDQPIKNPFLKNRIEETKQLIYDKVRNR